MKEAHFIWLQVNKLDGLNVVCIAAVVVRIQFLHTNSWKQQITQQKEKQMRPSH